MAWQNRVSFYKIPFSRTGVTYPLPTIGGIYADLESYKIGEIITEKPFNENQTRITTPAMTDALLACNYIRVGRVNPDAETPAGANDTNVSYFWCLDCYRLGTSNGEDGNTPGVFEIESDDVMTEFFSSNESIIKGRITRTSDNDFENRGFPIRKFCADDSITYSGGNLLKAHVLKDDTATVIASLTLNTGDMMLVACRDAYFYSKPYESGRRYLYDVINLMSNIYGYGGDQGTAYNASVTNITIVPTSFIGVDAYSQNLYKVAYRLPGGGNSTFGVYRFLYRTNRYTHTYELLKTNYNLCYIQTPCSFYMAGIPDYNLTFSIEINIPPGGIGSDTITISLILKNEIIDITQDYSTAFAVNDEAVKKAQFKQVNAIGQISNIIGAVGGVVGGVASGNYFGAVQSLVAGTSGLAENAAIGKAPAQVKSSGDAYNTFETIRGLCAAYVTCDTETTNKTIEKYGLPVETNPYVELPANTITESYYKFAECDAIGLSGGGQNAQATIETMFLRGVRFKSL